MNEVLVKLRQKPHQYKVIIGNDLLNDSGTWARDYLPESVKKIALISNEKVFGLYGKKIKQSLETSGFEVFVWLMKDGEEHKNFYSLEEALEFFSQKKLNRTDAVVALGGGVVGDLAGFASAIYLRGIPFLQIPTTLLAMIDSSVGGKTAVNSGFGKNLIGAFHQPNGVFIDVEVLKTLEKRELTAGFCEAVKQGAISGDKLLNKTHEFLQNFSINDFNIYFSKDDFLKKIENLLAAQISFKAEIVTQDEKESANRTDAKSRKILNFGHTLAHALEKITDYKYFKHGEAVGYGILFAAKLSNLLDIFDENRLNLLNDVVGRVGYLPETDNIDLKKVSQAFIYDKKFIGETLQWVLLKDIGKPLIYKNENIPQSLIERALKDVLQK
jgi:3-dehydroquinate synthase